MVNPFLISFIVSFLTYPLARYIAFKFNILDIPNKRKVHNSLVPRTGGIQIFAGVVAGLLLFKNTTLLSPVIIAAFIFILGLIEDKRRLTPVLRLSIMAVIAALCILKGNTIALDLGIVALPFWAGVLFSIFAIVGLINAFNMMDGLNGLGGGLSVISLFFFAYLSYYYQDIELLTLILMLISAVLGFLVFNFPSGKIFMGDNGSYFTGMMVAVIAIATVSRNPEISPWTSLLLIYVPVFETLFSIYRRRHNGKHPFKADKRHLHHILKRRYKSDVRVIFVIWALQITIGLSALIFYKNTFILILLTGMWSVLLRRLWLRRTHLKIAHVSVRI